MFRILVFYVVFVLGSQMSYGQLKLHSYLWENEVYYLMSNLCSSELDFRPLDRVSMDKADKISMDKVIKCSCGKIYDIGYKNVRVLKEYETVLSLPKDSFTDYETDLALLVMPIGYHYHFFEKDASGKDQQLFAVLDVYDFIHDVKITCTKPIENDWNKIMSVAEERGWKLHDIIVYNFSTLRNPSLNLERVVSYQGVSYILRNNDLIPLMEYLKANYTVKQFLDSFY